MIADVYYFPEFSSWGVTLYDEYGARCTDEVGDEVEAEWYAYKYQAIARAKELKASGTVKTYHLHTRDGVRLTA
jgi:hypothetical protein